MPRKLNVLLVNNSRHTIAKLEDVLAEIDDLAIVGTALNGPAGIRMTNESRPDLVLMDLELPGFRGLSALHTIRSMHPSVEVAMVSSTSGHDAARAEAIKLGACDVLAKPFDAEQIESLIDYVRTGLEAEAETFP